MDALAGSIAAITLVVEDLEGAKELSTRAFTRPVKDAHGIRAAASLDPAGHVREVAPS